jgi:hypothetical protein
MSEVWGTDCGYAPIYCMTPQKFNNIWKKPIARNHLYCESQGGHVEAWWFSYTNFCLSSFFFIGSTASLSPGLCFSFHFTDDRTPRTSDQPVARPLPIHRITQTQNKYKHKTNIYALCGIRTHDPSFRASEDSSCLRPLDYCDRRLSSTFMQKLIKISSGFRFIIFFTLCHF